MTPLIYTACHILPGSPIATDEYGAVRIGRLGSDLRISGTADDLTRLAVVLLEAAQIREDAA